MNAPDHTVRCLAVDDAGRDAIDRTLSPAEHEAIRAKLYPAPPPAPGFDEVDHAVAAEVQPAQQKRQSEATRLLRILDELVVEGGAL